MSKYVVTVGDTKCEYNCFACFVTADIQEVLEIFSDITIDEIKDYTLVLGSNIINEAFWDSRGEAYGEIVNADEALFSVFEALNSQGLSTDCLKYKIEV